MRTALIPLLLAVGCAHAPLSAPHSPCLAEPPPEVAKFEALAETRVVDVALDDGDTIKGISMLYTARSVMAHYKAVAKLRELVEQASKCWR